jgi:spore coat protein U-like protein
MKRRHTVSNPMRGISRQTVKAFLFVAVSCFFVPSAPNANAACAVSTTPVNFGFYDVLSSASLDSTGSITVDCSVGPSPPNPPVDVLITIDQSANSGSFNPRKMKNATGPDLLNYNLYNDTTMVSIWGDGTGGTSTVILRKVNKNRPPVVTTVYGRIPGGQDVSAGPYSDILTVTITW